jgi:uncharacterized protein (AIM24 family)
LRPIGRVRSHEIEYEVFGDDMQFVEVTLDTQESVIAEAGGMMYMSHGIQEEGSILGGLGGLLDGDNE